ncbi:MAG: hypothetical protein C5B51_14165 [Terriglobia bacterium]|nr:MAG: hypothetical protein C5B51_14165 [Terriglobia bacterium]
MLLRISYFGLLLISLLNPDIGRAQTAHPEVLVVYNSQQPDSLNVANHYLAQRNIPSSNLCAIAPPSTDRLALSDYTTYVQTPIQNCLQTVGTTRILYIVLSYLTPFTIAAGPSGTSSLDSYVADIWNQYANQPFLVSPTALQPYYADSQSQGNVYAAFQAFSAYRALPQSLLIYSVWRLDGPSAAIASALVDQAIYAESKGGAVGQACLDGRSGDVTQAPDASYLAGDWDLHQAANLLGLAGIAVVEDVNGAEFGTAPAPLTCPNTAFYSGWYSYNNYNDAFQWQAGSVGWHLDSASALTLRSGSSWVPNALARGIAVTSGSVDEPYLDGLVRPGGTFRNLLEGASVGDAFLRNTRWLKWEVLNVGDPLYRPFPSGKPPFQPPQPVNSFQLSPRELVGGKRSTATIRLSAPAPAGGLIFTLTGTAGSAATIPTSVTVPGGATTATFNATTTAVTASQTPVITASSPSLTLRNTLVIDPLLASLVPSTTTASAGLPITATVVLNGQAPAGGAVVTLATDNPNAAIPPPSVTVPAGAVMATFTISTRIVTTATTANITGSYGGATVGFSLSVVPALASLNVSPAIVNPGQGTSLGVFLASPAPQGGATVQLVSSDPGSLSVPATISVPAGSIYGNGYATTSPTAPGGNITITATYAGSTLTATVTVIGTSSGAATFIKMDAATMGNWKTAYGAEGYNVLGDTASYPAYASVVPGGQLFWTWTSSTNDIRALQKAAGTDRAAAAWYAGTSFTIDINLSDGKAHQVAVYCLDWDGAGRAQTIDVMDGSGNVLDSRNVAAFTNGQYLSWTISGHVIFRITRTAGINAVVSGLFFGGPTAAGAAAFVKTDSTTMGSWRGVYGADGFNVLGDVASYPAYAAVAAAGQLFWTWAASTNDVRALQKGAASDRVAATWYGATSFTIDVNVADGNTHQVALYCLDWDSTARAQTIDVLDAAGNVLDSRGAAAFNNGQYLVWNINGHVTFRVTRTAGANAVISGVFFQSQ